MRHARDVAPWLLLLGVSVITLDLLRSSPGSGLVPAVSWGPGAAVLPGVVVAVSGLLVRARQPSTRLGWLVVAVGLAWLVALWNVPTAGSALLFTVGLALSGMCAPLVGHAALVFPRGGRCSQVERAVLSLAYLCSFLLLGLLPALSADPSSDLCAACPTNLLAVLDAPRLSRSLTASGVALGAVWALVLLGLLLRQLLSTGPGARLRKAPASIAGSAFLGLAALGFLHSLARGELGSDPLDRRIWAGQAIALLVLATAVVLSWSSGRRTGHRVARLVLDLASSPPPGGLRDALAATLGDPSLRLAYALQDGSLVDAAGAGVDVTGPSTPLVRGPVQLAVLLHRPGLLDDPATAAEVARAARLVLDNERLHAELAAQLARLTASRQRIVATGDAARRRLERDLHDGAQQRLVALLLEVRLGRTGWDDDDRRAALVAEAELLAAIDELRTVAHGIFPAVLADEGLAEAVQAFAEGADVAVRITGLPDERLPAAVEGAAYFVLSEAVRLSSAQRATVGLQRRAAMLCVHVTVHDGCTGVPPWIIRLEDRVGAVEGRLEVARRDSGVLELRAELPCGS